MINNLISNNLKFFIFILIWKNRNKLENNFSMIKNKKNYNIETLYRHSTIVKKLPNYNSQNKNYFN